MTLGIDIPAPENWRYIVPPPPRFATGELPYPLLIGPERSRGSSTTGKTILCTTSVHQIYPNDPNGEGKTQHIFSEALDNDDLSNGLVMLGNIRVKEPGIYRLEHVLSMVDEAQKIEIRHATVKSYKLLVEDTFDNSTLRLTQEQDRHVKLTLEYKPEYRKKFEPYLLE